jgi:hypothetical protein
MLERNLWGNVSLCRNNKPMEDVYVCVRGGGREREREREREELKTLAPHTSML